ncbi:unnamed protein product [Clonostachys rosea f. rosea IK726]|jgi:hypothetical protein|uniref:Uncharacterized protein n=1 Tax=Clonostachys rosea f. rosea IK726 TaxID=1349383 RepID=A0ACA9U659_BIOOC|nr:unnamed protein product [Clonostachys rosea f. rosea IK726]
MLPPEIWSRVFSNFLPPTTSEASRHSLKPLYSLCLVSRQFRQIAQPLLYHTISVDYQHLKQEPKLVRSLFESPELARAVRRVALRDHGLESFANHRQLLEDVIRSSHAPEAFKHGLETRLEVADTGFATIVLAMTTAVHEIDIALSFGVGKSASDLLSFLAGSNKIAGEENPQSQTEYQNYGLPSLKRMSLGVGDEMCASISGLESVLLRPGLEQLCITKVYWHLSEDDATQWPEVTSDLPSLTLHSAMVNGHSIQDIFTRFPNLRVFNYTAADRFGGRQEDYQHDDPEWGFRAGEVGHSLRTFGTKLEALTLRTTHYREGEMWDGQLWDDSLIGSLREMNALRKLEIDLSELRESDEGDDLAEWARSMVDFLPPNLEELIVPCLEFDPISEKVSELIRGQYFPALRLIAIVPAGGGKVYVPSVKDEDIPGWAFVLGGVDISTTIDAVFSFQRKK